MITSFDAQYVYDMHKYVHIYVDVILYPYILHF